MLLILWMKYDSAHVIVRLTVTVTPKLYLMSLDWPKVMCDGHVYRNNTAQVTLVQKTLPPHAILSKHAEQTAGCASDTPLSLVSPPRAQAISKHSEQRGGWIIRGKCQRFIMAARLRQLSINHTEKCCIGQAPKPQHYSQRDRCTQTHVPIEKQTHTWNLNGFSISSDRLYISEVIQ